MPVYLITYLVLFWIPVLVMGAWHLPRLSSSQRKAFWIAMAVMTAATLAMEFVYLGLDIWTFSEAIDPLLGVDVFGVPVEEFVFWWGASPLFVLLYLTFSRLVRGAAPTLPSRAGT